ncbi:hypothetical protein H2201_008351 [Coniosporium apollinis]|uniref:Uncharacterized protein n=1 Tax=Coniosporium apollinis TaxID=61459 RepID=A0ABQ9NGD1_9PEZI|nr:hypothetical protein H2201_008351 [Coniosporium apollinis]
MKACETGRSGLPPGVAIRRMAPFVLDPRAAAPQNDWQSEHRPIHTKDTLWQDIVSEYSNLSLTYPCRDRLAAIAGIAERMAAESQDVYVAGLWIKAELINSGKVTLLKEELEPWATVFNRLQPPMAGRGVKGPPTSLLWRVSPTTGKRRERFSEVAPSWSWASVDGGVSFPIISETLVRLAWIVDVGVNVVDGMEKFGQTASAKLTLEGLLMPATWDTGVQGRVSGKDEPINVEGYNANVYGIEQPARCVFDCGIAVLVDQANVKALAVVNVGPTVREV